VAFYFFVHLILGALAGSSGSIVSKLSESPSQYPKWMWSPWAIYGTTLSGICAIAAIPTTFVEWGFLWTLATIGELVLGAALVVVLPLSIRFLLVAVGPVISVVIIGALWGFWRI
jgi:hypothetical protein